jgi:predicted amidohydrolase
MPPETITIAIAQSRIEADVRANGRHIRGLMSEAKAMGARLIQFPEGALSGYAKSEIEDWATVDWTALRSELETTAVHASQLGIWLVCGSNHPLTPPNRPHNSLYIISDKGALSGRYDKRLISYSEITDWYTPGVEPFVFEVDGYRFGCALCIEIQFPEIFTEYERLGVDCILCSAYSDDPVFAVEAQAHAAMNNVWFSLVTPASSGSRLPCSLIGPDGLPDGQPDGKSRAGLVCATLDRTNPRYEIALNKARPWRAAVRAGIPYRLQTIADRRSTDRFSY